MANFLIIHFNTPDLTSALVRSINKFCCDAKIYIFDNSTISKFVNKFSNVTVFDNTTGKYVNFVKELKKYPNRHKSLGRASGYGSFKHCISVNKCFDLINEPFILLDSDVLLKKDVTEIIDGDCAFVGHIKDWSWDLTKKKYPVHKRVEPFICYINVPFCKSHGIKYFDEKHMVGTYYSGLDSDSWDVGCWFYECCKNEKYKEIEIGEYVEHFGGASYRPVKKLKSNRDKWLNEHKDLYMETKRLIVTSIIGGYEKPTDGFGKNIKYDYILVSDKEINTKCWKNYVINFKTDSDLSSTKKQRYVKTHLCELFKQYELICYVDGNTTIDNNLYQYIENNKNNLVTFKKHIKRDCIYDEINVCERIRKEKKEVCEKLRERYLSEGYPKHNGLFENNVIVIRPKNEDVRNLFKLWWREIYYNSQRDQLSLNYVIWKNHLDNIISVSDTKIFKPKKHIK